MSPSPCHFCHFLDAESLLNRLTERMKSAIDPPASTLTPAPTTPGSFSPSPYDTVHSGGALHGELINHYRAYRQQQSNAHAGLLVVALECVGQLPQHVPYLSKTTLDCLSEFLLYPSPTLSKLNRSIYRSITSRRSNASASIKVQLCFLQDLTFEYARLPSLYIDPILLCYNFASRYINLLSSFG